jgi:hypothetical protein
MNGQAGLLLLGLATAVDGARGAADATPLIDSIQA